MPGEPRAPGRTTDGCRPVAPRGAGATGRQSSPRGHRTCSLMDSRHQVAAGRHGFRPIGCRSLVPCVRRSGRPDHRDRIGPLAEIDTALGLDLVTTTAADVAVTRREVMARCQREADVSRSRCDWYVLECARRRGRRPGDRDRGTRTRPPSWPSERELPPPLVTTAGRCRPGRTGHRADGIRAGGDEEQSGLSGSMLGELATGGTAVEVAEVDLGGQLPVVGHPPGHVGHHAA